MCLATANLPASLSVNPLFPTIPRRTFFIARQVVPCGLDAPARLPCPVGTDRPVGVDFYCCAEALGRAGALTRMVASISIIFV